MMLGGERNTTAETATLSVERVYEVATRARLSEVEAELARLSPSEHLRDPRALAMRGTRAALSGDVPGGIQLLRRAMSRAPRDDRPYYVDLLVPFLLNIDDVDAAEALLTVEPGAPDGPSFRTSQGAPMRPHQDASTHPSHAV